MAAALTEAMRAAEREKTGEILLKDAPQAAGEYILWRNGLLSAINRSAPKGHRVERDAYIAALKGMSRAECHKYWPYLFQNW